MSDVYVPSFFSDDQRGGALTYEQLLARRKIAAALATRNRGFPKTVGEGLTYLGESIGDNLSDRRAAADEAKYRAQSDATVQRLSNPDASAPAAVAPAARPAPSAGAGPMSPDIDPFGAGFPSVAPQAGAEAPETVALASDAAQKPPQMSIDEWVTREKRNESGGAKDPYRLIGPVSRRGDYPYGAHQVMGENIPKWTKQFVGREMTPQEFLLDDKAQDQVARGKGGEYLAKYGPEGAAAAWFAGERGMNDPNRKDTLGTHVAEYKRRFSLPLVSRDQVAAAAARNPAALAGGQDEAGMTMAYAPEGAGEQNQPPVQLASLGGGAPTPDTASQGDPRAAIAATLAGPPPQQVAAGPAPVPQPQQQMPVGTPVPTGAAPSAGPPPQPQQVPMSPREMEIRKAIGSSSDPRVAGQLQPLADRMEAERKFEEARRIKQWESDLATWKSSQDPVHQEAIKKAQEERANRERTRAEEDARGGIPKEFILKGVEESAKKALPIREASTSLNTVDDLLQKGVFSGTLGKFDLAVAKAKAAAGLAKDPKIASTEEFTAAIAPIVAAARTSLVGNNQISNADLAAAKAAAGGDISLDADSIKGVMKTIRQMQANMAMDHHKTLETAAGGNPQAEGVLYGQYGLPMENIIPKSHPRIVERMLQNADNEQERAMFNKAFHTPGLAEKIIAKGRP